MRFPTENLQQFGLRLRALREQAQLTQGELADLLGTFVTRPVPDQSRISRIETGKVTPTIEEVRHLAEVLDANAGELLSILLGMSDAPSGVAAERITELEDGTLEIAWHGFVPSRSRIHRTEPEVVVTKSGVDTDGLDAEDIETLNAIADRLREAHRREG